ncbi:glyoxalase/bleomycin resistance protein/dihydroxybiphenyl dioxygenase [Vibrio phage 1.121.O._10N.286.46.C4]|nr:glyoxalase/bleomycin resistance protein/dihydroxybiphenyl dioxygenase [Vibrio phage 1.121.O._10N.286.46.C4]
MYVLPKFPTKLLQIEDVPCSAFFYVEGLGWHLLQVQGEQVFGVKVDGRNLHNTACNGRDSAGQYWEMKQNPEFKV